MDSHARLHAELTGFLRQHCPVCDERHLVLLGWMVTGLLLSQTVCFDEWKRSIPMNRSLPASWQRRCRCWLSNGRIDRKALYCPLALWAMQQWQKPGHALHLALDTTVLWNRFCVVVPSRADSKYVTAARAELLSSGSMAAVIPSPCPKPQPLQQISI